VSRLQELGWNEFFERQWDEIRAKDEWEECFPARVSEENRGAYRLLSMQGEHTGELSGKLRHQAGLRADLPAVGDWVAARENPGTARATIHRVFDRSSKFSRKVAGKRMDEQIVAANVDVVLLVTSLNRDFNMRRIERYLSLTWESGARPVIVLNKSDLCENAERMRSEAESVAMRVPVVTTSAVNGDGIEALRGFVRTGTAALLGSSGVGKSSLINALLREERQPTRGIREDDDRGRHTTTSRQLILVPRGGVLIDTPGMRELQLWDADAGILQTFADIAALAEHCRFRDCRHRGEPGCAVEAAVENDELDAERLESFHKLEREEQFIEAKQDASLRAEKTKELRKLMRGINRFYRDRRR